MQLLSEGRLVEAQDLVVGTSAAAKKAGALHCRRCSPMPLLPRLLLALCL